MKIVEITPSIHGELPHIGRPCTIIRFSGCNLNCPWCDTKDMLYEEIDIDEVLKRIFELGIHDFLITGGEPLLHKTDLIQLLSHPAMKEYYVLGRDSIVIETNGTQSGQFIRKHEDTLQVTFAWDLKPLSLIGPELFADSLQNITSEALNICGIKDVLKFVFNSKEDFDFYCAIAEQLEMDPRVPLIFSPTWNLLKTTPMRPFVEEMIQLQTENLNRDFYFQTQLHKTLGIA